MDAYKYDHAPHKHKIRYGLMVLLSTAIIVGGFFVVVAMINLRKNHVAIQGTTVLVPQKNDAPLTTSIDKPLYNLQLPSDWKQIASQGSSFTWQATLKNADNRWLTIYTDVIPVSMPVNRELPLIVHGDQLTYGELSDNCANFTPGGTLDVAQAEKQKPAPSVWQGVNFVCNIPQVIDNQIGTGSSAGVNTTIVSGPTKGTHSYFFLYTDRNIQPDYTIFYNAIQSFHAK